MSRASLVSSLLLCAAVVAHKAGPTKLQKFRVDLISSDIDASYSVSVSPSSGLKDGDYVTVSYASSAPSATDLVIAYSPLPADFSAQSPVEWFYANQDPSYMTSGQGSLRARLINMRDTYSFVLATGDATKPTVKAVSNTVAFANPNEPRAARLALTGVPTEMRVAWNSRDIANPVVTLLSASATTGKGQVLKSVPAVSITYNASDLCGAPASTVGYRNPGYIHTAVLTGLVPGTRYSYTVGDSTGTLGPYTFLQPALGNSPAAFPFVFTAVGDMGQLNTDGSDEVYPFPPAPNTTLYVARDIAQYGSQLHMHIGDLSYARGYASEWDFFWSNVAGQNLIAPLVPYHVNLGNHEADFPTGWPAGGPQWLYGSDSGGECAVPATRQFLMPSPDGVLASRTDLWWAVEAGPVFTVHFSSEQDSSVGGPLWTFVKTALASVDRSRTPWVVVATHRPMYISSTNTDPDGGDQSVASILRQNIEPLLMNAPDQPVDLFLQGHHHSYQRGSCVLNLTDVKSHSSGPNHVYQGGLAPLQMVIGTGGAGFSTNIQTPQPSWAEVVQFWHGYARVTIHNASALQWQFVNDLDGSVADEAWLVK